MFLSVLCDVCFRVRFLLIGCCVFSLSLGSQRCQLCEVAAEFRAGERVRAAAGSPDGTQAAAAFSATGRVDVCQ